MKRLILALAALLFSVTLAMAEAPACMGTNLLDKLQREDPQAFAAVMAEAAKVKNGEAIFWKIERAGLKPSWLLGTAHVTDPRVTGMTPEARAALSGAGTVALELREIRDRQEMALAAMKHAKFMVLPSGQSLWDLIPDDQESLIRDNPNFAPGVAKTIFSYQPWVVSTMLSIPLCESLREQQGQRSLDMQIAQQAGKQGSELVGLETMEEQMKVMSSLPLDLQVRYLVAAARMAPRAVDYFETLVSLYDQRKVTAFLPLTTRLEPADKDSPAMMAFLEQELIAKRNRIMSNRAAKLLALGNVFIAVGAMHLPGDEGLVELLRRAGYKVTPVN
jgi:uncharacterized protein YbaP (TraB family)